MFRGAPVGFFSIVLMPGHPCSLDVSVPPPERRSLCLKVSCLVPLSSPGLLVFGCWVFGALE